MKKQGIKRHKRKQTAYKILYRILGVLVALISVATIGFWVMIFIAFC